MIETSVFSPLLSYYEQLVEQLSDLVFLAETSVLPSNEGEGVRGFMTSQRVPFHEDQETRNQLNAEDSAREAAAREMGERGLPIPLPQAELDMMHHPNRRRILNRMQGYSLSARDLLRISPHTEVSLNLCVALERLINTRRLKEMAAGAPAANFVPGICDTKILTSNYDFVLEPRFPIGTDSLLFDANLWAPFLQITGYRFSAITFLLAISLP